MTRGLRDRNRIEESSRSVSAGLLERPENTNKASKIDEAIEYQKQLQLQVQVCGSL
ncbi:hypothetical protein FH972_012859 [Carpinus fangiana]|uniref:BHLH domain-containing protein n=1 Tax=Carpinus fangiana TaxID=176857 RepID=A0A5N6R610_9ROSI|nr:hypothetical protein FH972_012859 [Carpinus fangiana]